MNWEKRNTYLEDCPHPLLFNLVFSHEVVPSSYSFTIINFVEIINEDDPLPIQ